MADGDNRADRPGLFDVFMDEDGAEEDGENESDDSDFDVGDNQDQELNSDESDEASDDNAPPPPPPPPPAQQDNWIVVIDEPVEPEPDQNRANGRFAFTVRQPGPQNAPLNGDPIDFFGLFFDDEMWRLLVRHTNAYARTYLAQPEQVLWIQMHPHSRLKRWPQDGITIVDIKKYLGLSLNMGLNKKLDQQKYWTTRASQRMPFFGATMGQRMFLLISRMFHVNSGAVIPRGEPGFDPWHKVRPVLDALNAAFKRAYKPSREISIDESMIGMKNRCAMIQFMPNKRHARFGIKKFQLCDSANGYVCHVDLYAGRQLDVVYDEGQAHGVVMNLMTVCSVLNKGYHLFTDNFYTKPRLADVLSAVQTYLTGTVRSNSRGLGAVIQEARPPVGGTLFARQGGKVCVAFREKRSQRKPVLCLSTFFNARNEQREIRGREKTKPAMIFGYNAHMGGVDLSDKKVCHIAAERATRRYWVKVFRNLLDIAVLNAFEVYRLSTPEALQMSKYDFVVSIVESLCAVQGQQQPVQPEPVRPVAPLHRIVLLPGRKERDCVVCSDRTGRGRKRARHWCPGCEAGCHELCEPRLEHYRRVPQRGRGGGRGHRGRGGRGRGHDLQVAGDGDAD
ncbi:hypothetical protein V1264_022751 [Littorina saxatilis]|uniref:PiggyBac transposable element-derived protein domain-containing protein n=2 Tax=Littorina saxatilis TaxID=31220 RepID=A0AAN9B6I7_9CAEN